MSVRINNDLLRERFLDSGMTAYEVAKKIGWVNKRHGRRPNFDSSRVKRTLGINIQNSGNGYVCHRRRISLDETLKIAEAIGVDPHEVGA